MSGIVSSLDRDGLVAYVHAATLLAADPGAGEELAIKLQPGVGPTAIGRELGLAAAPAGGATARGAPLVRVLRTLLRALAIVDGLVCVYALVQTCALTVQERRRTVAVLRALGADGRAVRRLLGGAVSVLVVPAAVTGVALEHFALGPMLSRLAAGYASLSLAAGKEQIALVLAGLAASGAFAVGWVSRRTTEEPVLVGLRGSP